MSENLAGSIDPRARRTRATLLEAAVSLAATRGLEAARVSEICRAAGVNRATFYRHFEDKEDLLERGLALVFEDLAAAIEAADRPGSPFESRVVRRVAVFFAAVDAKPEFYRGLVSGAAGTIFSRKLELLIASFFEERRMPRLGSIGMPADLAARALASTLLGFVSWRLDAPSPPDSMALARLYLRFATRGILADLPEPQP